MPGADFASILGGCRPLFPAGLLDSAGWERLLGRAKLLPRSVIDAHFGFEFHLGEPGREADLFVVVRPGSDLSRHHIREGGRAERGPAAALGAGLREQAADPDSFLARSVAATVLEYDADHLRLPGFSSRREAPSPGRGRDSPSIRIPRACLRPLPRWSAGAPVRRFSARSNASS